MRTCELSLAKLHMSAEERFVWRCREPLLGRTLVLSITLRLAGSPLKSAALQFSCQHNFWIKRSRFDWKTSDNPGYFAQEGNTSQRRPQLSSGRLFQCNPWTVLTRLTAHVSACNKICLRPESLLKYVPSKVRETKATTKASEQISGLSATIETFKFTSADVRSAAVWQKTAPICTTWRACWFPSVFLSNKMPGNHLDRGVLNTLFVCSKQHFLSTDWSWNLNSPLTFFFARGLPSVSSAERKRWKMSSSNQHWMEPGIASENAINSFPE